jgi:hypothetical protein
MRPVIVGWPALAPILQGSESGAAVRAAVRVPGAVPPPKAGALGHGVTAAARRQYW